MLLLLTISYHATKAQTQQIQGRVLDQVTNEALSKVRVTNISRKVETVSKTNGAFQVLAAKNDLLAFEAAGYRTDTVLITEFKPLKQYLLADVNTLQMIRVNRIANYKKQYAQVLRKARAISLRQGRGLLFSPSRYFGREGRQARYFKKMIKKEQLELEIDRKFNAKTITAILPLKQPDLDVFIQLYRPSLAFVRRADAEDFKFYLIDAYNKFKLLPPEKRKLIELEAKQVELSNP